MYLCQVQLIVHIKTSLMKSVFFLGALICAVQLCAQDCTGYYFLRDNSTVEMEIYNRKGQVTGRQISKVNNVKQAGGVTTAEVDMQMLDKKGKETAVSKSLVRCENGVMLMNINMFMPAQQGGIQADVTMSDVFVEFPASMQVGDQLKDARVQMDIDANNGIKQTVELEITDRKVEGREKVSTAAGSWDCFKISQKTFMRIRTMGIGVPVTVETTEWFAPGFGVVKTESKHGGTAVVAVH